MQCFAIAISALLVTTNSPKDCEDGYFTGYIFSLSIFAVSVFLCLMCFSICQGLNLDTYYYTGFFDTALSINLILVFLNFLYNLFEGNDCGFYSVRGFAASFLSLCSFMASIIYLLIEGLVKLYFGKKPQNEAHKKDLKENTFEKANKISQLRDDFYAMTFLGYVYKTEEQRKEIIVNEDAF